VNVVLVCLNLLESCNKKDVPSGILVEFQGIHRNLTVRSEAFTEATLNKIFPEAQEYFINKET
jgi:hypothetical protein